MAITKLYPFDYVPRSRSSQDAVANPKVGPGEMLKIADLLVLKKIGVDTAENRHHCEGPGVRRRIATDGS